MAKEASWYCHSCQTYGGGEPNNMTIEEHIDFAHDGYLARVEEV